MQEDFESATIGVIGLGMAGLYQALEFCNAGRTVLGYDISVDRLESIVGGNSVLPDVNPSLILSHIDSGRLVVTGNPGDLKAVHTVLVSVPTDVAATGEPRTRPLEEASSTIASHCTRGILVVVKSSSYPGLIRRTMTPWLNQAFGEPVEGGFSVVYAPERSDPGNRTFEETSLLPRIIGGLTPRCIARAKELYSVFRGEVHVASSLEAAEFTKLHENVFRFVNIAYVNELSSVAYAYDVDIDEVVRLASTKPFGFMPFWAGAGIGGMYIPVNPSYLLAAAGDVHEELPTVEAALKSNATYFGKVCQRISERLGTLQGARVLALGATYKSGSNDIRNSPAVDVIRELFKRGAIVTVIDPRAAGTSIPETDLPVLEMDALAGQFDVAILLVDHPEFYEMQETIPVPLLKANGLMS